MAASPPEMVDWIDEDGNTLASLPRSEIRRRNLLHRVTATFVFHPDGRLFVHQRSPAKDVYPALFDLCVGGTVVSGEDYAANACREVREELGVAGVPIYELFGHRFSDAHTSNRIRVFACVYDGPLRFQPEEVVDGRWCTEAEVERTIEEGRMCPDSTQGWRLYLEAHGRGRNFARELAPTLPAIDCGRWLAPG
ncbi:MAG TPA: NUDIX domain-containing protein [bacterium]|nr:NUDIX domain-containing protein [bacterium]